MRKRLLAAKQAPLPRLRQLVQQRKLWRLDGKWQRQQKM
jgi:hypothetical protein